MPSSSYRASLLPVLAFLAYAAVVWSSIAWHGGIVVANGIAAGAGVAWALLTRAPRLVRRRQ